MKLSFACLCAVALVTQLSPVAAATKHQGAAHQVIIDHMAYGPVPHLLRVGDTIVWVNHDFLRHTATASDKSFNVDLKAGKSARTVLTHAGRIMISCTFHPGMKTALVVAP